MFDLEDCRRNQFLLLVPFFGTNTARIRIRIRIKRLIEIGKYQKGCGKLKIGHCSMQLGNQVGHKLLLNCRKLPVLLWLSLHSRELWLHSSKLLIGGTRRWRSRGTTGTWTGSRGCRTVETLQFAADSFFVTASFTEHFSCNNMLIHLSTWRRSLLSLTLQLLFQSSLKSFHHF